MSLRLRLTLTYSLLVALILGVFSVVLLVTMRETLSAEMDRRLHVRANQVQLTIWPGTTSLTAEDLTAANLDLAPLAALNAPNLYVQVMGREGRVIDVSENLKGEVLPSDQPSLAAALEGRTVLADLTVDEGLALRTLHVPISVDGKVVGVLVVGQSREALQETMTRLQGLIKIIGFGFLLIAALIGWVVAHRGLLPLNIMSARAAAITAQRDFSRRLALDQHHDEVGQLARTIDELLGTIDETLTRHRTFVADTSHELRNPLLAIRFNLDLLDKVETPEERLECIAEARQQIERMSSLVADLLVLARTDAGELIEQRPVALDELVEQVRQELHRRAADRKISVTRSDRVEIPGDAVRLTQVISNLVDNALKFTPAGGEINLELSRENEWARIVVSDTGEGIAPEHLPYVFDRFYHVASRAAKKDSGTGLGLAIVKHLAEAHGGHVSAESEPGVGSRFMVWLPVGGSAPNQSPAS